MERQNERAIKTISCCDCTWSVVIACSGWPTVFASHVNALLERVENQFSPSLQRFFSHRYVSYNTLKVYFRLGSKSMFHAVSFSLSLFALLLLLLLLLPKTFRYRNSSERLCGECCITSNERAQLTLILTCVYMNEWKHTTLKAYTNGWFALRKART